MIGLIPKIWVMTLERLTAPESVSRILEKAGYPGDHRFALDQPYDDGRFAGLIAASSSELGMEEEALLEAFSKTFIEDSVQRWPVWYRMAPTARDFLERQPRIHDSFYRAAGDGFSAGTVPKFQVTAMDDGLRVEYRSHNRLCRLYTALARALLDHYGDAHARVTETCCMHEGHDHCEIRVRWPAS